MIKLRQALIGTALVAVCAASSSADAIKMPTAVWNAIDTAGTLEACKQFDKALALRKQLIRVAVNSGWDYDHLLGQVDTIRDIRRIRVEPPSQLDRQLCASFLERYPGDLDRIKRFPMD